VKKIDVAEHVNITKVIDMLSVKDKELAHLKNAEKTFDQRLVKIQVKNDKEQQRVMKQYQGEIQMKSQIAEKVNALKGEIKGFE
jgi:hypothetical protein